MANKLMQLVPYLTKNNYQSWSNKMKELLISQDMLKIIGKLFWDDKRLEQINVNQKGPIWRLKDKR